MRDRAEAGEGRTGVMDTSPYREAGDGDPRRRVNLQLGTGAGRTSERFSEESWDTERDGFMINGKFWSRTSVVVLVQKVSSGSGPVATPSLTDEETHLSALRRGRLPQGYHGVRPGGSTSSHKVLSSCRDRTQMGQ